MAPAAFHKLISALPFTHRGRSFPGVTPLNSCRTLATQLSRFFLLSSGFFNVDESAQTAGDIAAEINIQRAVDVSWRLDMERRKKLGQFMTSRSVAELLAQRFGALPRKVRLLGAGAGMGALTVAFV